jgi:imidazolonepropionase-like amidohydrolase
MATWGSPDEPKNQPRPKLMGNPPYARAGIQPERLPADHISADDAAFKEVQKLGFGSFAGTLNGGMLPGRTDFMFVTQNGAALHKSELGIVAEFDAADVYPSTLMGMMAKMRGLWYKAEALMEHQRLYEAEPTEYPAPERDAVLESLFPVLNKEIPVYFVANLKEDIERVLKLQKELGFELVLVGGKEAHTLTERLKSSDTKIIASIDLPEKPKWMDSKADSSKSEDLSEEHENFRKRQQSAYKKAMENIRILKSSGLVVGITSYGIKTKEINKKIAQLVDYGYSEKDLLPLMTIGTATCLGLENQIGSLKKGYLASFIVTGGPVFDKEAEILYSVSPASTTEFEMKKSKKSDKKSLTAEVQ